MLRQIMTAPGVIEFSQVPIPALEPGEVLVKIMKIGICGSDIHVYHGKHPFTQYPITQGHEVSGKIVQVTPQVTELTLGQKVTIEPQVVCGDCYPCRHGKYNLCENLKVMGFQTMGTGSEYFAVSAAKVTPLPYSMTYSEGAMIEPLAVTVHAAKKFPQLTGSKVAIIGCGPIGILLAQTCLALGAAQVLITDLSDTRLNLAKACGITFTANTSHIPFSQALTQYFGPDKADVIFDCAGNDDSIGQAVASARKGSKLVLVAVFSSMAHVDLAVLNDHELDLDTSMMYRHEDYVEAIRLVQEGKILLRPLMTKHFPFLQYLDAYRYIDENRESTMKVIIDVDETEE